MKTELALAPRWRLASSQGDGVNLSVIGKLRVAEKFDAFGVH
jgi:hypothetical protein